MARAALILLFCVSAFCAEALTFSDRFRSPRNPERRIRRSTSLVVLHTTEAHARSSLNKLSERGEAHYCVTEDGVAYRIIDRDREAFHAGCSMWNGREDCDSYSIGIEVVGWHDRPVTAKQIDALRELLATLKRLYGLNDSQIVCHSHVAYGNPNRWHHYKHRGRKRCGMQFATWTLRRRLGLNSRPQYDPDVAARRLRIGDDYLNSVLYGRKDVMAGKLDSGEKKPNAVIGFIGRIFSRNDAAPAKAKDKKSKPQNPKSSSKPAFTKGRLVVVDEEPPPDSGGVRVILPDDSAAQEKTDFGNDYFPVSAAKPKSKVQSPKSATLAPAALRELVASGAYTMGGPVRKDYGPMRIAGRAWRSADTYYLYRGQVTTGNKVNPSSIAPGTYVFYRKK